HLVGSQGPAAVQHDGVDARRRGRVPVGHVNNPVLPDDRDAQVRTFAGEPDLGFVRTAQGQHVVTCRIGVLDDVHAVTHTVDVGVVTGSAFQNVEPCTAIQGVVAGTTDKTVAPAISKNQVVAGVAVNGVAELISPGVHHRSADQVGPFNVGSQLVVVDQHQRGIGAFVCLLDDHIGGASNDVLVVAFAALERVDATVSAAKLVVADAADDQVASGIAVQHCAGVVACEGEIAGAGQFGVGDVIGDFVAGGC